MNDSTDNQNTSADVLLNLENLIKSHDANIERIRIELKKQREMLTDILTNNSTYKQHEEKAKEANKVKNMTKGQILKQPNCADIVNKIKDMQVQVKELSSSLSEYLREYSRLSGSSEIEGEDGEVREIVYTVKLVKKSSRSRL